MINSNPKLCAPLRIPVVVVRNRIAVSPVCQYSCEDGFANYWHFVHVGNRAIGGAGLVMAEATEVEHRGRMARAAARYPTDEPTVPR